MKLELDKVEGIFLGCAIGDAMGWPVEFNPNIEGGSQTVTDLPEDPVFTDDTQMTIAVAKGVMRGAQSDSVGTTAEEVAEELIKWLDDPSTPLRGPGSACLFGARMLKEGAPWNEAGKEDGKGCGAAMRSSPYGIWWFDHPWKGADWAGEHALMTHRDPSAQASAAAIAAGISSLLMGDPFHLVAARMAVGASTFHEPTSQMLSKAFLDCENKVHAKLVLDRWRGWKGDEAAAASLYCLGSSLSFTEAVVLAVNSPGDSDSLGAITGALAGARWGAGGIPPEWRERVEGASMLKELAKEFWLLMRRAGRVDK